MISLYVIDAHTLLWYMSNDKRLGKKAREIMKRIDNGEEVGIVPSIVILESLYVAEKYGFAQEFINLYKAMKSSQNYFIHPLSSEIIDVAIELPHEIELHDRIIIATARCFKATIITKDDIIKRFEKRTVW